VKGTATTLTRVLGFCALVTLAGTVVLGLWTTPPDVVQGELVRLIYIHPAIATMGEVAFGVTALASLLYLWRRTRDRRWDLLAGVSAEVGVVFASLTLVTGSIWGRPTWGVWWTWDARLTLTAILLLIYTGYLMLRSLIEDESRAASAAAVLGIIGFLDIPLIHMSVYWWRTLHQPPSILQPNKPPWENVHPSMLTALAISFAGFLLLYFYLLSLRYRLGEMREKIKARRLERGV